MTTTTVRRIAHTIVNRLTMRRRPLSAPGVPDGAAYAPWRVFLSHTGDLREQPAERSFAAAAEAAVIRAGHAVSDMAYFAARDVDSAHVCAAMVAAADVYVGIVGRRYGATVPSRPHQSFTELEFATATDLGLPRLVFVVRDDAARQAPDGQSVEHRLRQAAFRDRLCRSGLTVCHISSPSELELALLHTLVELRGESVALAAFMAGAVSLPMWGRAGVGAPLEP
ncbi:MAG TPA: DUF4062 domain-containing protein [Candidatus Dormibacteraeota bacterium]|jgi:hypothetical protein